MRSRAMAHHQSAMRTAVRLAAITVVGLVALPFVVVVIFFSEHLLFGTRHFGNGLEAIGLTKVLQTILDALGMNG